MPAFAMMRAVSTLISLAVVLLAVPAPARSLLLENLVLQAHSAYEGLERFSVKVKYEWRYEDDFWRYRQNSKYPMDLHWPSGHGEALHQAKADGLFVSDRKMWWEDGTLMTNERLAWDGLDFQRLNRFFPGSANLYLARKRQLWGVPAADAHRESPLTLGMRFLRLANPHVEQSGWQERAYLWNVSLDMLRQKKTWQDMLRRLRGDVEPVRYKGQHCLRFNVNSNPAPGERNPRSYCTVWLPVAAPSYPLRVEIRAIDTSYLWNEWEVDEFFDAVEIAPGSWLRFPKTIHQLNYTEDPNYRDRPYDRTEFDFSEYEFNGSSSEDVFKIDPALARRVHFLDTGKTISMDNKATGSGR